MFVHLRLHTEFSVVDGTTRIDEVVKAAAKDGQPALAITDLNNLFGALKLDRELAQSVVQALWPDLAQEVCHIQFEHSPARGDAQRGRPRNPA